VAALDASTEPVSVTVYNTARAAPSAALNALTTLLLAASLIAVLLGYLVYRRLTRGEKQTRSLDVFTGEA
jgi:spermidine/putrescine transport system permease protein